MTPLERAARALHKDYVEGRIRMGVKSSDLPAWEDLGPDGEFAFYAPARAVIEAIREPSDAMVIAGDTAPPNEASHPNDLEPGAAQMWPAMVDALLHEGRD